MPDAVLVIGAGGFVGRRLVRRLVASGHQVIEHRREHGSLAAATAGRAITHVVNAAGRTYVPDSWNDPVPFYADNVQTTAEALRVSRQHGAPLVHISSYVYGTPRSLPISESHPLVAGNPYAHSKIVAESIVDFHREHMGVRAAIIRPFNLYGPGQGQQFVIPRIVSQLLDPDCHEVALGDLRPKRDYLHVDDLVELIMLALHAGTSGTYNAGSGHSLSVRELADEAARVFAVRKEIRGSGESRQNEVMDVVADITAASQDLGWQPRITLNEGLRGLAQAAPDRA
jgi:nucleoside-diphosphate-sugar epimerase